MKINSKQILWSFPVVDVASGPRAVATADAGKLLTNAGASAEVEFTLPSAAASLGPFYFAVADVDGLRVTAAAGDSIKLGDLDSGPAGFIRSDVVNSVVGIVAIDADTWIAWTLMGTWTNVTPTPTAFSEFGVLTTTAVDLKVVGNTTLYTVPSGLTFVPYGAVIKPTSVTAPNGDSQVRLKDGSGNVIVATTIPTGMLAVGQIYWLTAQPGLSRYVSATGTTVFEVVSADTGTALSVTVDLLGYTLN